MDVTLREINLEGLEDILEVLILVLMDVTLRAKISAANIEMRTSLNPCFNGCYSSRRH